MLVKSQFTVKADDFVISKRQIVHQACGIVPEELDSSIVSNEYNVFKPSVDCCIRYFDYLTYRPQIRHSFFLSCAGVHLEKMLFNTNDWLSRKFYYPSVKEQHKIADFLTAVDKRIAQLTEKKTLLEDYKKGAMQQLLTQAIRFKDDHGNDFPEWEEKPIGGLFKERNERGRVDLQLLSVSMNQGVHTHAEGNRKDNSSSDKGKYKRVAPEDIAYNSMRMWQGASAVSNLEGIVSPAYTILTGMHETHAPFYGYLFKTAKMIHLSGNIHRV